MPVYVGARAFTSARVRRAVLVGVLVALVPGGACAAGAGAAGGPAPSSAAGALLPAAGSGAPQPAVAAWAAAPGDAARAETLPAGPPVRPAMA